MPYLLSDMAAGSNAVRQMQLNAYRSATDQQVVQEEAKQKAIQTQQAQANVEKSRLDNLVSQTNYDRSQQSLKKLSELASTDEWKKGNDEERMGLMGRMLMESGQVEQADKVFGQQDKMRLNALQQQIKEHEVSGRQLEDAAGVLKNIPDEQVNRAVESMRPEQQKAIFDRIPKDVWMSMSGSAQKAAVEDIMMGAKGQIAQTRIAAQVKEAEIRAKAITDAATIRSEAAVATRLMGIMARAGGSEAASAKTELSAFRAYQTAIGRDKSAYNKGRTALEEELKAAQKSLDSAWFFKGKETTRVDDAIKKLADYDKEFLGKQISLAKTLPKSDYKEQLLAELEDKQAELFPTEEPKTEQAKGTKPAAKPEVATSNKPASTKPQFEEGKIYQDAQGNKAKYVNGKWVPV